MKCSACSQRDEDGQLEERCVENRKRWACDERIADGDKPLKTADELETDLPLMRCPWAEAVPNMTPILPFLRLAHEQGFLPAEGGMLDQTADFSRGLLLYGRLMQRVEAEQLAEQQDKSRIQT